MTQIRGFSGHHLYLTVLGATMAMLVLLGTPPALAEDAAKDGRSNPLVSPSGPLELVKSSVTRAQAIIQSQPDGGQRRAEIRQMVEGLFDFNEMARRTLAQHWAGRSAQEQEEFVRLFTDLLERSYLTTIGNYRLATITFQGESVEGSAARVRSRIATERGAEIPVEYRLLERGGRWAVYDVAVEGVSLVSSYRSQFNSVIRNSSFERLLDRMRNREARLEPVRGEGR